MCKFYQDKLTYIAIFYNVPLQNINYAWKNLATYGKWKKTWYIHRITPMKGLQGIMSLGRARGQQGLYTVNHPWIRTVLINHAKVTLNPCQISVVSFSLLRNFLKKLLLC